MLNQIQGRYVLHVGDVQPAKTLVSFMQYLSLNIIVLNDCFDKNGL